MHKWYTHEIILNAVKSYNNPYLDVDLTAVFVGPAGQHQVVKGFWDGGHTYRVCFTPTDVGRWHYTLTNNQDDSGLVGGGALAVTDAPPAAHGFLRRDSAYPTSFSFDDGTRYFMWGTTYYGISNNARAGDRWKAAIDGVRRYGINKARMHIYPFNDMQSARNPYPDTQSFLGSSDQPDHDQLNLAHWQALDRVVQYIGEQGLLADLIVFHNNDRVFGTDAQSERFARYAIARYAAYPHVIWCVCNEWNYSPKPRPFWNRIGQLFRDEDPWMGQDNALWAHSIHQQTRVDFQFFQVDWPVHAIVQYGVCNGQKTINDE